LLFYSPTITNRVNYFTRSSAVGYACRSPATTTRQLACSNE